MKKRFNQYKNNYETVAPAPVVANQPRSWNVNCPKCGATLKLKEDGTAYLCPVCTSVLRVKTGARLVKNLNYDAKQLHINVTYPAALYIARKAHQKPKKQCWLVKLLSKKKEEVKEPTLQDIVAQIYTAGYTSEDYFVVDCDEGGLFVRKS